MTYNSAVNILLGVLFIALLETMLIFYLLLSYPEVEGSVFSKNDRDLCLETVNKATIIIDLQNRLLDNLGIFYGYEEEEEPDTIIEVAPKKLKEKRI